jgi:hypothetical protein
MFIVEIESSKSTQTIPSEKSRAHDSIEDAIVICGFNNLGSSIATYLSDFHDTSNSNVDQRSIRDLGLLNTIDESGGSFIKSQKLQYVAFDLDPNVVIKGYRQGKRVLYGDGCQPLVLLTAGVQSPRAFVVTYIEQNERVKAVEKLRQAFPYTPIISR